jgi:uncharacterized protein (DUF488 family)
MSEVIYTIGHSTRTIGEFIRILKSYGIEEVADVRTIPRSRHNPQYNKEYLREELEKHGIGYVWLKELGGLRHTTKASINTAWKNASFRGYADYMQTPEFSQAVERLVCLGKEKRSVIMCAEALPWRCHRSLIGDALLVRGLDVMDIMGEDSSKPHTLTPWARVNGYGVTYPGTA